MYRDKNGVIWYKGNLHTHTTRSDGLKSPEDTIKLYADADYDFIALTDHWVLSMSNEGSAGKDILVLSGVEYDTGSLPVSGIFHVLGIGMRDDAKPEIKRGADAQEIINGINSSGGLAVLAHPAWSLNTPEQIMQLKGIGATEIFNSVSDLPHNSRPNSGLIVDMLAALGNRIPCLASDDTHFYSGEETRSWIMLRSPSSNHTALSTKSILAAIRKGSFYATQGPHFEVFKNNNGTISGSSDSSDSSGSSGSSGSSNDSSSSSSDVPRTGIVTVECPEECDIDSIVFFSDSVYVTDRSTCRDPMSYGIYRNLKSIRGTQQPGKRKPPVTVAHYKIKPSDTFVRVEVNDSAGRQAWSSPIRV